MLGALEGIVKRWAVVAAVLLCAVTLLCAPSTVVARDQLTRAEAETAIEGARQEIARLTELRRESPDDPQIRARLLDQHRMLGSIAHDWGGAFGDGNDFRAWVGIAREIADDEPADAARQLDVLDALFAFAAYEWDVRPNSEDWLAFGREGLALVRQLRETAREDVQLRTALGERLKAFPDEFVTCFDRCASLDEEAVAAMAGMADDALDDPRAQLTYVELVQGAALRSGQEHLSETVSLLERSIDLAPRIAEPDWRKGALVRSSYDLQMFQRNGGHAAAADAAVTDLVAALTALEPAGVLNSDDRWCMKRLADPATRERALDSCLTWAITAGVPCLAVGPQHQEKRIAIVPQVYPAAISLFSLDRGSAWKRDMIDLFMNSAADPNSNPYCPQVRYYLGVALSMIEDLANDDPPSFDHGMEQLSGLLFVSCAPFEGACSTLRERALAVFRRLVEDDPQLLASYLELLSRYGAFWFQGPNSAWAERLLREHRALSPRLEGIDRDIATRDGALVLAAILEEQGRNDEFRALITEAVRAAQSMAERNPAFAEQANACTRAAEGWTDLAGADASPCMSWPKGANFWAR